MNAIALYRIGRWCHDRRIPLVPRLIRFLMFLVYNSVIPVTAQIGEGTTFGWGGVGVALHPECRIGRNVRIGLQVTIGGRSRRAGVPRIEDDCIIGAGARILGPIRVGRGSAIGANAVVLEDVPPGCAVAGVPARIVRSSIDIRDYWA